MNLQEVEIYVHIIGNILVDIVDVLIFNHMVNEIDFGLVDIVV